MFLWCRDSHIPYTIISRLALVLKNHVRCVGGFLEQYQVLLRVEHDRLLDYGKHRFQKDLIDRIDD